ncbi:MAG: hypothetical protein FJ098_11795, partial [Deltaproteobacteria bacterium]|nr:hypothetical protein [Deltaproteobacteria bacterium]
MMEIGQAASKTLPGPWTPRTHAVMVLLVGALGCGPATAPGDAVPDFTGSDGWTSETPGEQDASVDPGSDLLGEVGPGDGGAPRPRVVERTEMGATWACEDPATCTEDYLRFLEIAPATGQGRSLAELAAALAAIDAGEVDLVPGPVEPQELAAAITGALGI